MSQRIRPCLWIASAALVMTASVEAVHGAPSGKRIFLSVDIEGISGAVSPNQMSSNGRDYEIARAEATAEVLAAIAGAEAAGATEFVIADAHGDFQNLLNERLPANVTLIRGAPRPLAMMEGIDRGHFDGAMLIGYHAGASSLRGIRPHTISGSRISELRLNGVPASEAHLSVAIAAQYGVPVILVTGDDVTAADLKTLLPNSEMAVVKRAISFQSAETISPSQAQARIREKAELAVRRLGTIKPGSKLEPVNLDLTFAFYRPAELLSWLPIVRRIGPRSIRYQAKDMRAVSQFLQFTLEYSSELQP